MQIANEPGPFLHFPDDKTYSHTNTKKSLKHKNADRPCSFFQQLNQKLEMKSFTKYAVVCKLPLHKWVRMFPSPPEEVIEDL